jgi:hypothetical protein
MATGESALATAACRSPNSVRGSTPLNSNSANAASTSLGRVFSSTSTSPAYPACRHLYPTLDSSGSGSGSSRCAVGCPALLPTLSSRATASSRDSPRAPARPSAALAELRLGMPLGPWSQCCLGNADSGGGRPPRVEWGAARSIATPYGDVLAASASAAAVFGPRGAGPDNGHWYPEPPTAHRPPVGLPVGGLQQRYPLSKVPTMHGTSCRVVQGRGRGLW